MENSPISKVSFTVTKNPLTRLLSRSKTRTFFIEEPCVGVMAKLISLKEFGLSDDEEQGDAVRNWNRAHIVANAVAKESRLFSIKAMVLATYLHFKLPPTTITKLNMVVFQLCNYPVFMDAIQLLHIKSAQKL